MKKKKIKYSSVLTKGFCLIFISILTAVTILVSVQSYNMLLKQTINGKINEITLINQKIGSIISYSNAVSNLFYYNEGAYGNFSKDSVSDEENENISYKLRMDKARIKSQMDNLVSGFDVVLTGNNGLEATSMAQAEELNIDILKNENSIREGAKNAKESGQILLSGLDEADKEKRFYVKYTNIYSASQNEYLGTLFIIVDENYFEKSYSKLKYDLGKIFLADREGDILNKGEYADADIDMIQEFIANDDVQYSTSDKNLMIKDESAETGWMVAEIIPLENISNMIRNLVISIIVFAAAALAIGILVIASLAKKLIRPLADFNELIENSRIKKEGLKDDKRSSIAEIDSLYKSFNEMNRQNAALVDKLIDNENEKRLTELNYMRVQINPHFIYNTLFSIRCTVDMDRKSEALKMIDILNKMLRRSLKFKEETTSIAEELIYIRSYIEMLQFSYDKRLILKADISEEIQSLYILRFILQPIVENAVFHGIQPKNDDGEIIITGMKSKDSLEIVIHDNGVGIKNEILKKIMSPENMDIKKAEHIGIVNIHNRIRSCYGDDYGLKVESKIGCGTSVYIKLPVIEKGD